MMEETSVETSKSLVGLSGLVYGLSFNPDKSLLLSCGEDGVAKLWSLQTWTYLVCYKGHKFPAWDCTFSPSGYYIATSGHDRTSRLWAKDQSQPLGIFHGHFSDVDCLGTTGQRTHQFSTFILPTLPECDTLVINCN